MSRLIIITGDLASGKSSLADSLSLRLNIPCFKKDVIKENLVDKYGFTTREENRALSIQAVDFMFDALKRFASKNEDIILEANFREEELLQLKDISDFYQLDTELFVLRGDIEVLYSRFLERLPKRHVAHTSIHLEDSIDRFSEYLLSQRLEVYPFIPHIIDTTFKGNEEVFQIALNYLEK